VSSQKTDSRSGAAREALGLRFEVKAACEPELADGATPLVVGSYAFIESGTLPPLAATRLTTSL
jgi:hypothetical protein